MLETYCLEHDLIIFELFFYLLSIALQIQPGFIDCL